MKAKNLKRLMALDLPPVALAEVLAIFADENSPLEKRREADRKWQLKKKAKMATGTNGQKTNAALIKFGTEQWRQWEKYRGKPIPSGRSGTWEVESEWPPGYTPEGTIQ